MIASHFLWPNGRRMALTTCWDDGTEHDRRLIEILNRHGLKGSFNLCSGKLDQDAAQSGWKAFVRADEVATLYQGHEVCAHTVNHRKPWSLPSDQWRWEALEDRRRLEALVGYPVRGFVIPFSWKAGYASCMAFARAAGFLYMRQAAVTMDFDLPDDFLDWQPTCHCGADLAGLWAAMRERSRSQPGMLFYLWGHSYEFADELGWDRIESFAARAGATEEVWFGTKGEVYDYVSAWRRLSWTLDGTRVRNPSATPVWFRCNGQLHQIEAGQFLRLEETPA